MKLFKYSFEGHSCSYDDDDDNNDNVFAQAKNAQFLWLRWNVWDIAKGLEDRAQKIV